MPQVENVENDHTRSMSYMGILSSLLHLLKNYVVSLLTRSANPLNFPFPLLLFEVYFPRESSGGLLLDVVLNMSTYDAGDVNE